VENLFAVLKAPPSLVLAVRALVNVIVKVGHATLRRGHCAAGEILKIYFPSIFNISGHHRWDFSEFVPAVIRRRELEQPRANVVYQTLPDIEKSAP
jgi:hypothetical protein